MPKPNLNETNRRLMCTALQCRAAGEDESSEMILSGRAVPFDSPEHYVDYTEVIDRSALNECDMSDVVLRYNHKESAFTCARTRNKSLELEIKEDGLYFTAKLCDTQHNRDIYNMVKSGLLDRMSFAFTIEEYSYDEKKKECRILKIDRMFDIALVDFPFYSETSVEARSLDNHGNLMKVIKTERRNSLLKKLRRNELIEKLESTAW